MSIKKFCAASCAALSVFLASHLLVSCSAIPGYSEPEEQAIVCAMGFDAEGDGVKITIQLAESGGEKVRVIEGDGRSIEEAISYIAATETSSLEVAHLAVIVLGRGIDRTWFDEIIDFCERNDSISTSSRLVSSNDAASLLSNEDASGYKLSEMIQSSREDSSFGVQSRLYKIKNTLLSDDPVFAIPHFFSSEDGFELYGVRLFRAGEGLSILDREEGAYYMMLRGLYSGGVLGGDATGLTGSVGISSCRTEYSICHDEDTETLTVRLKLSLDSEVADDEHTDEILRATARNAERLYAELSSLHGDVFGFSRIAEREGSGKNFSASELSVCVECERRR